MYTLVFNIVTTDTQLLLMHSWLQYVQLLHYCKFILRTTGQILVEQYM